MPESTLHPLSPRPTPPTGPLILAPLRGFTDLVFRNAFVRHIDGIDEAVAPFVTSLKGRRIKASHLRELAPEENRRLPLVPQILSNNAHEFICLANTLLEMGYTEVNWNLGCPYPMVAKKKRGSGLLPHADTIDHLLEEILSTFAGRLSIKTRLGRFCADEMKALVPVFNRYPLSRVIVHPRLGVQMYTGTVDLDAFQFCLDEICHPLVYNGDITHVKCFDDLVHRFPTVSGWMVGRGVISDPFLAEAIRDAPHCDPKSLLERFGRFHADLVTGYGQRFSGPGHVLDRMKGFWRYFADGFDDGPKILKAVRKATSLARYETVVQAALSQGRVRWAGGRFSDLSES